MSDGSFCSWCRAPLAPGAHFCARCLLAVRWEGHRAVPVLPEVRAGNVLLRLNLVNERPPGLDEQGAVANGSRWSPHASGMGIEMPGGKAFDSQVPFLRRRDLCVRAGF